MQSYYDFIFFILDLDYALWNQMIAYAITLGNIHDSISNCPVVIPRGSRDKGTRGQLGEGGICLPLFWNSCAARKSHDMLTSSMPVRLRLERHTSMPLFKATRPVYLYVSRNLDCPLYAWIAPRRQSDREDKRTDISARTCGCMQDELEGEDS